MVIQSPPSRPEPPPDQNQLVIRAAALGLVAAILFGILIFRLWALQVLHSDHYVAQANQNEVRQLDLPAPRGQITTPQPVPARIGQSSDCLSGWPR